jgi:hypothetical protein
MQGARTLCNLILDGENNLMEEVNEVNFLSYELKIVQRIFYS